MSALPEDDIHDLVDKKLEGLSPENQQKLDGSKAHIVEDFIDIKFQLGPIAEHGVNGTTIERVIELLTERLEGFQAGPFQCVENQQAIFHLTRAKQQLEDRTTKRKEQGVEGKNLPHNPCHDGG